MLFVLLVEVRTLELGNVHVESIAFFEDLLAAFVDELVELLCKAGHAITEIVEAEVDDWQRVGH